MLAFLARPNTNNPLPRVVTMPAVAHTRLASPCIVIALALAACGDRATPAAAPGAAPAPVLAPSVPNPAPAPSGDLASAVIGAWRQICLPYIPGDGASDITYTITRQGASGLKLEGVAKDYKNTSCAGSGVVIATPVFSQKIAGSGTLAGVSVLKLVDDGAPDPAPIDAKSVVGIDNKQLRFGKTPGPRDAQGFPSAFEAPRNAYNRLPG